MLELQGLPGRIDRYFHPEVWKSRRVYSLDSRIGHIEFVAILSRFRLQVQCSLRRMHALTKDLQLLKSPTVSKVIKGALKWQSTGYPLKAHKCEAHDAGADQGNGRSTKGSWHIFLNDLFSQGSKKHHYQSETTGGPNAKGQGF